MTITLGQLREEARQRLGDSAKEIWSDEELCRYIQQGYEEMTLKTGCLFAVHMYPDVPASFTTNNRWEQQYMPSGQYLQGPATFTATFERDYADNSHEAANHNYPWEFHGWSEAVTA